MTCDLFWAVTGRQAKPETTLQPLIFRSPEHFPSFDLNCRQTKQAPVAGFFKGLGIVPASPEPREEQPPPAASNERPACDKLPSLSANPTACPTGSSGQAGAPPPPSSAFCHLRKDPPCDADAPAIQSMQICRKNWFRGYFRGYLAR